MERLPSDKELVKILVEILDEYSHLYFELSGGRTSEYLRYVELNKADEERLVQPNLFPDFLTNILGFSKALDYIPEQPGAGRKKPDFTPTNLKLHPFLFETKGNDSATSDLVAEYFKKSKLYLENAPEAEDVIITNMRECVVFAKKTDKQVPEVSFNVAELYTAYKQRGVETLRDDNTRRFLNFVQRYQKRELTTDDKISAIANASPHEPLNVRIGGEYREADRLTDSLRKVIGWMYQDVSANVGAGKLVNLLPNADRRRTVAMELFAIRQELSATDLVPEKVEPGDLEKITRNPDKQMKNCITLFFHRVAYFNMARILLLRAWEDSGFIDKENQMLYDGGFSRMYFGALGGKIDQVLSKAFQFAKDRYYWLFTEETNYSWYIPSRKVIVDVLYELGKYNLSVLNRDILGTIYEDYLDIQDKKNKGQYFTPAPIVELIWDRLGYSNENAYYSKGPNNEMVAKRVFDPATGSGSFLVEAARRLRADIYERVPEKKLERIHNAITGALFGSEISPFSYYITEINLLLQLTPVIKKMVETNPRRRGQLAKFSLKVIRQDSLSLHNPTGLGEQEAEKAHAHSYYGFEILKPVGEKLATFDEIKNKGNFDYVVGNPPYIGEDEHKELFRRTLALFPYWRSLYQGKMDYLYFFVMLGIQKLAPGGKMGFITTSYWLTADGGSKLRQYILDHTRILEIVNFHEVKLFEHAKGQHNIVFILQREKDQQKRQQHRPRILEVQKPPDAATTRAQLGALCKLIRESAGSRTPNQNVIMYEAPVQQKDLGKGPWHLFHSADVEALLRRMEAAGMPLEEVCDVFQGLVPGCLAVDKAVLEALPQKTIDQHGIRPGMGVFVLSKEEVDALGLAKNEFKLVRPYFKNSDVHRYVCESKPQKFVIYTNKDTDIENFPGIHAHLEVFKPRLEKKREAQEGKIPWWSLHWPREERIFDGEKIVCPYRSPSNVFGYSTAPFYGSTDLYFITKKTNAPPSGKKKMQQASIAPAKDSLLYVLGILNSKVMTLWTLRKTSAKGRMRELFFKDLKSFPIKPLNMDNPEEKKVHDDVVEKVSALLDLKTEMLGLGNVTFPPLTNLYEEDAPPSLKNSSVDSAKIAGLWAAAARLQGEIDGIVCKLYGVSRDELNEALQSEDVNSE